MQPSHQDTMLVSNKQAANHWHIHILRCHRPVMSCSVYMFMSWLSYREVEGMVIYSQWLQFKTPFQRLYLWNHWIFSTRHHGLWRFISVNPQDIFEKTQQQFPTLWLEKKKLYFWWEVRTLPAMFVVTKIDILKVKYVRIFGRNHSQTKMINRM